MNKKNLRRKGEKGITLVALIITIIVLLILAVVAIRAVQGDGIIGHAKNAQTQYEQAQAEEEAMLESYLGTLEADKVATTMKEAQSNTMLSKTKNSEITDRYGNKIVVPAGFKILVDSTTDYTADTIDVTKGIVIQDGNGNEFVWIPVGDVYTTTDTEKTTSNTKTIPLERNAFGASSVILAQNSSINNGSNSIKISRLVSNNKYTSRSPFTSVNTYTYTEEQPTLTCIGANGNAIAKNINNFYEKAIASHGYYIGRYEAGKENNTLVCKANKTVYESVTQPKASELCQSMYTNKPYESDLVNSYAWDTAIVFIQTFGANGVDGKETDSSTYESQKKSNGFKSTGANQVNGVPDKYRNIYDMSGNASEWTTETSSISGSPCTRRGGFYNTSSGRAIGCTSNRAGSSTTGSDSDVSFRPLLYV